mmetsp:Transcript_43682/g.88349  ORF Transcript_43682/g.88349 Transcript_43682/m.88349 type:complete len:258 (-) Transcript_43682:54-827(-)
MRSSCFLGGRCVGFEGPQEQLAVRLGHHGHGQAHIVGVRPRQVVVARLRVHQHQRCRVRFVRVPRFRGEGALPAPRHHNGARVLAAALVVQQAPARVGGFGQHHLEHALWGGLAEVGAHVLDRLRPPLNVEPPPPAAVPQLLLVLGVAFAREVADHLLRVQHRKHLRQQKDFTVVDVEKAWRAFAQFHGLFVDLSSHVLIHLVPLLHSIFFRHELWWKHFNVSIASLLLDLFRLSGKAAFDLRRRRYWRADCEVKDR